MGIKASEALSLLCIYAENCEVLKLNL